MLEAVCGPILELVYRIYTDEQYAGGTPVKDCSIEIVEQLQKEVDKSLFIETYSSVKNQILEKLSARKMHQKQLVGTSEGLAMRQRKRELK